MVEWGSPKPETMLSNSLVHALCDSKTLNPKPQIHVKRSPRVKGNLERDLERDPERVLSGSIPGSPARGTVGASKMRSPHRNPL